MVPAVDPIFGGVYDPAGLATTGPIATLGAPAGGVGNANGTYNGVLATGGTGVGATFNVTIGNTATVGPIATLGAFTAGSTTQSVSSLPYTAPYPGVVTGVVSGAAGLGATVNINVGNTASVGPVAVLGVGTVAAPDVAGPNTYTGLATTGGTGLGLTLDITTDIAGNIATVTINAPGSGYSLTDTINVVFGVGNANYALTNILVPIAVTSVALAAPGTGYDATSVLNVAPGLIGGVTGFTVNVATVTLPTGVTNVVLASPGTGYNAGNALSIAGALGGGASAVTFTVATITKYCYPVTRFSF
jgi:hypothetical protein